MKALGLLLLWWGQARRQRDGERRAETEREGQRRDTIRDKTTGWAREEEGQVIAAVELSRVCRKVGGEGVAKATAQSVPRNFPVL